MAIHIDFIKYFTHLLHFYYLEKANVMRTVGATIRLSIFFWLYVLLMLMTGRTVTSSVKWISCKISLVISQSQVPFRQFNKTHAIFSVSYFNGKYVISY